MFLLNFFSDLVHPFRDARPQTEDSDDEAVGYPLFMLCVSLLTRRRDKDESMSLADNNSEADPSDLLEVDSDFISMSEPTCAGAETFSDTNLDWISMPPTSPLYERPVLDDYLTPFSERHCAMRRARSAARHSPYKIHSREQRQAFIRNYRHKEMFVDDPHESFIPAAEPSTFPSMSNFDLPSLHADLATTPHNAYRATQNADLTITIPSLVDRLGLQLLSSCKVSEQTEENEDVVDCASQKSGLTIKIPGLVDRLALRLLSSLDVKDQTEEDEDVDTLSSDGYTGASESSSDGGDIDDDDMSPSCFSSPTLAARGPDRSSRRKHRRLTAAPYHRAGGIPKRKEFWMDTDSKRGIEVPAFLLESPSRGLRSRHC